MRRYEVAVYEVDSWPGDPRRRSFRARWVGGVDLESPAPAELPELLRAAAAAVAVPMPEPDVAR